MAAASIGASPTPSPGGTSVDSARGWKPRAPRRAALRRTDQAGSFRDPRATGRRGVGCTAQPDTLHTHRRVAVGDHALGLIRTGAGPALLLLHGFTGSAETWSPFLPAFAERFDTIAVDLLGHGAADAPTDPDAYRLERAVADLAALLDRLGIGRCALLGYSMGGRLALGFAVAHPERVAALVLEGASPGIADPAARRARAEADAALADAIERDGTAAFVDRWERLPLFASQRRLPADRREELRHQRLRNRPAGLANSLRGFGQGAQPPLLDRLGGVTAPALLVVGEDDEKFRDVAAEMAEALPDARIVAVPGAGHAVHLERPEAFRSIVLEFLPSAVAAAAKEPAGCP